MAHGPKTLSTTGLYDYGSRLLSAIPFLRFGTLPFSIAFVIFLLAVPMCASPAVGVAVACMEGGQKSACLSHMN